MQPLCETRDDPYVCRECRCDKCQEKCRLPEKRTYYVISRGPWRTVLTDEGREETFVSLLEARDAIHEHFVPGPEECYVEKVERTSTVVWVVRSLGPKLERLEFWARVWKRYTKTQSGRSAPLREKVLAKAAQAQKNLDAHQARFL